jgi:hypothetical protein
MKIAPKKYETKEFNFLCLPILNYCIVVVTEELNGTAVSAHRRAIAEVK